MSPQRTPSESSPEPGSGREHRKHGKDNDNDKEDRVTKKKQQQVLNRNW
jgi:hypothetical protein